MPDDGTPARPGGRQLAGQPWWVWAAGGVALVGGYVYLRRKGQAAGTSAPASSSTTAAGGSPTGLSWEQFLLFLHDQQSSPAPAPKPAPKPKPKPKVKPKPKPRPRIRGGG